MAEFDCPECEETIESADRGNVISQAQEHVQNNHQMSLNQDDIIANIQGI